MLKEAQDNRADGRLVCEIIVTHNFFCKQIPEEIDPRVQPNGSGFCCITSFKFNSRPEGTEVTLIAAGNDNHVITRPIGKNLHKIN